MSRQQRDVLLALMQWRNTDGKHIEPIGEFSAKAARRHLLLQVAIRCRDDAHIGALRLVLPHPLVPLLLQDAEELALPFEGHLPDLVRKQRAAVG